MSAPGRSLLLGAALALGCAGCGSGLSAEEEAQADAYRNTLRQQIRAKEELADILAGVRDRESMAAALKTLAARYEDFDKVARQMQSSQVLPRAVRERAEEGMMPLVKAAADRELREVRRINSLEIGAEFFEAMGKLKKEAGPRPPWPGGPR